LYQVQSYFINNNEHTHNILIITIKWACRSL